MPSRSHQDKQVLLPHQDKQALLLPLLDQLIDLYEKLLQKSYTDGLLAARRFGPDIMTAAGRLQDATAIPHRGGDDDSEDDGDERLARLCREILNVAWREYVVNPRDVNYYVERAYRESLGGKEEVLRRLLVVRRGWERGEDGEEEEEEDDDDDDDDDDDEAGEEEDEEEDEVEDEDEEDEDDEEEEEEEEGAWDS